MPLERFDATPKPTRTFFNRPSQSNAISLDVEARALTTPVTAYGDIDDSENDGGETVGGTSEVPSETGFDRDGRSHHSAPIVHSLS